MMKKLLLLLLAVPIFLSSCAQYTPDNNLILPDQKEPWFRTISMNAHDRILFRSNGWQWASLGATAVGAVLLSKGIQQEHSSMTTGGVVVLGFAVGFKLEGMRGVREVRLGY